MDMLCYINSAKVDLISSQKFRSVPKTETNKKPNNYYKFLLNVSNVLGILSTIFSMFYVLPVLTLMSKTQSSLNLLYHPHTVMTSDIPKDDARAAQNNLILYTWIVQTNQKLLG